MKYVDVIYTVYGRYSHKPDTQLGTVVVRAQKKGDGFYPTDRAVVAGLVRGGYLHKGARPRIVGASERTLGVGLRSSLTAGKSPYAYHLSWSGYPAKTRRSHGDAMAAPHYAVRTSSKQQAAIRALHLAEKNLDERSRHAETFLHFAKKLYVEGDYEQSLRRALDSLRYSVGGGFGDMKFLAGHGAPESHFTVRLKTLPDLPHIWYVIGPRVVRGGRVDYKATAYYGTIHKRTGKINAWGGEGAAGKFYKTYLEVVRDRLKKRVGIASRYTGEPLIRVAREAVRLR